MDPNPSPLILAGYCYGGLIAFETASRLAHIGHETALILLDVPVPGIPHPKHHIRIYLERGRAELQSLGHHGARKAVFLNALRLVRRLSWHAARPLQPAFTSLWSFRPVRYLHYQLCRAYLPFYKPRPASMPILHFFSADEHRPMRRASRNGWQSLTGNLQTGWIPGDHDAFFRESNLPGLASQIATWVGQLPKLNSEQTQEHEQQLEPALNPD